MLVPVPPGVVLLGVVLLPGTVDDGIVVLCGTWFGLVVVPGTVLLGTLSFGLVPCCKLPGVVVRGTELASEGRVVEPGDVVLFGVVTLPGTVLDGTVDGCVVEFGTVVGDGCVTVLPGLVAPGRSDGCTAAPGTVFGCVVLPG
ncbi:conserved hypothetical protein [Dyadobacter fermentans DSM 18053]|uniref:Uncharacterized protein n=1 Tax=Dyadobacter fermentans (strain ATCC 700827 / DSM 18053 / CIP 107007 / KCTC 52180 / NS114) TaxID=471854 RepID=C6VXF2_DYAFD|nr:conserved hypothetical protein [Dyadobacter fermentans DSM 18053]